MENTNDNNTSTITTQKIKPLTKNIRNKIEQKAYYLIDNIRRRDGSNPFYQFDTYHEIDSKTDACIFWESIPIMIKNVKLKSTVENSIVCLLDQKWLLKKQTDNLICLVQMGSRQEKKSKIDINEFNKPQEKENLSQQESSTKKPEPLPLRFSQAELQAIRNKLNTEKVFDDSPLDKASELTHCFDFSNAFVHNGAYSSTRKYFNLSLKTFEAILDELEIKVADSELTRETEAFYTDKKTQTIYMMSQNELMGLIQHTGVFKTGKHSNQNLRLTAIAEQFNVIKSILADENRYNPLKIVFDNVFSRLRPTENTNMIDAIIDCFIINHGDNLEYEQACKSAIKKFLISAIAAIYRPVFNSRLAPVFVGRQEYGKSSLGRKLFGIVDNAFLTQGGFDVTKLPHQLLLFMGWVLEIADSPKIFRQQDLFETYKGLTNPEYKVQRKYKNEFETLPRRSVHYLTGNDIDQRDDENTRNPIIRIVDIDLKKMDEILGLRHVGNGIVEVIDAQKRFELWHQLKCCYDRGESYELTPEEQMIFKKFANKNNKKTMLATEFEDMLGIDDNFEYNNFLLETVKGARYQIGNLKLITTQLAKNLSTTSREVIPQDLDKKTGELNTLINRYFPDVNLKLIWCPVAKKPIRGFKIPVMLDHSEQEALAAQRQENKGKDNIALLNDTTNEQQHGRESASSYQSEYTQEELQKMAERARL